MKPRILAICSSALYMSNLRTSLLRNLEQQASEWRFLDVTDLLVGKLSPGDILAAGREADVIVLNGSIFTLQYPKAFSGGGFYSRGRFPYPGYAELVAALWDLPARRVFIADNLDLHGDFHELDIRPERLDALIQFYYPDRFTPRSRVEPRFVDPWMDQYVTPEVNYEELLKIPVQIELADCLDPSEFAGRDFPKYWQFGVPGIQYARRKVARAAGHLNVLNEPPFNLAKLPRQMAAALHMVIRTKFQNKWAIGLSRFLHHRLLAHTAVTYTDGSAYDYAVRKFIEIPAQRSVLLCTPHPGMADYGYRDGVTHIEVGPDEAHLEARRVLQRPRDAMVRAAFENTWERHRVEVRAAQLRLAIEKFAAGTLRSARFHQGEFVYEE